MTNFDFIKSFFRISLPLILSQLMANLINTADTVMLGALAEKAISGAAVANKVFFIYSLTIFGLTNGIGIFISQFYGAKNKEKYNQSFRFGIILCLTIALVALCFACFFDYEIINLYIKDEVTIEYALKYLNVIKWTFIPFALSQMFGIVYRVIGKTEVLLYAGLVTFITNVSLNYLLIFGKLGFPALGVEGAAIATLVARCIESLFLLLIVNGKNSNFKLLTKFRMIDGNSAVQIFTTSIPLVVNELIWSIGLSVIFMNYSSVGEAYLPALTVADNIGDLVFVAFTGSASVISVYVGRNLGLGRIEEAKLNAKRVIALSLKFYIAAGILMICFSSILPSLYSLSGDVLLVASKLIIIKGLCTWTQEYSYTIYYILRSGGDTKSVLILDGVFTWLGPVLISFVGARVLGLDMITLYSIVEGLGIFKAMLSTYFYRREKWVKQIS